MTAPFKGQVVTPLIYGSLFLALFFTSCSKEEDALPDKGYSGTLVMEYKRSFPELTASVDMNVNVDRSGQITITDPQPVDFAVEDEIVISSTPTRMNENGIIAVDSPVGEWKNISGSPHLEINVQTTIEGNRKIWEMDEVAGWTLISDLPVNITDPVPLPLQFKISDATDSVGAVLGNYSSSQFGTIVYQYILMLEAD